jgi:hypothetical protein
VSMTCTALFLTVDREEQRDVEERKDSRFPSSRIPGRRRFSIATILASPLQPVAGATYRGSTGCSGRPAGPARCGRHRRGTTAERRHNAVHGVAPWLLDGGCARRTAPGWGADVCYCVCPRFARSPGGDDDDGHWGTCRREKGKREVRRGKNRSCVGATWIAGGRRPGAATSRDGEMEVIVRLHDLVVSRKTYQVHS